MTGPRGSECGCALCGAVFTGMGLSGAHQDVNYTRDPVIVCGPPAGLGLVQDARGTWGTPEGLRARERSRTMMAAANSERRAAPPARTC